VIKLITELIKAYVAMLNWKRRRHIYELEDEIDSLYDPPTVTLIEGAEYQFKEGIFVGSGQKFHSDYSYRRAIIIGK
jgi:hypothetical protein